MSETRENLALGASARSHIPALAATVDVSGIGPVLESRRRRASSIPPGSFDGEVTLIDELIAEQRSLTAVAKYAQRHHDGDLPAQARYYRDLIPLSAPGQGQQYRFEVNLDQCSGCKACVTACHSLNGLDETEIWRSVGHLRGDSRGEPLQLTVTTSCHHCVDPACANGCPVLAYHKDPVTGIVRHLDDQCIGCQYCVWKCPYEVPKYNASRGIVRKCDMCSSRLASGEAPACVQACPNEAIRITVVDLSDVVPGDRIPEVLVPGAPLSEHTGPTTAYLSRHLSEATLRPADLEALKPEPPHAPLVIMLVLSQLSVGSVLTNEALRAMWPGAVGNRMAAFQAVVSAAMGLFAIAVGTTHLGRPLRAWRAVLGLRQSWLSREIVAFGLFLPAVSAYALCAVIGAGFLPTLSTPRHAAAALALAHWAASASAVFGLLGLFCSVMLYHDTKREFWNARLAGVKFGGTSLLLGLATSLLCCLVYSWRQPGTLQELRVPVSSLMAGLMAVAACKIAWEVGFLKRHLRAPGWSCHKRSALLMLGVLRGATLARFAAGILAGVWLPAALLVDLWTSPPSEDAALPAVGAMVLWLGIVAGECLERYQFFRAVTFPRMPGGVVP